MGVSFKTLRLDEVNPDLLDQCYALNHGSRGYLLGTLEFCEEHYPRETRVALATDETGTEVYGWALVDRGFLQVFVRPRYRHKGLGTNLVARLTPWTERWSSELDDMMARFNHDS